MEVVAGVSSVASLLGIVGQSIDGILKLRRFVYRISTASKTLSGFLQDIDSLKRTLTAVSDLIRQTPEEWLADVEETNFISLVLQVDKCQDDIRQWVEDSAKLDPNSSRSVKAIFKKLRIAGDPGTFSEFHRKVANHQQGIQLSLGILGRCAVNALRRRLNIDH